MQSYWQVDNGDTIQTIYQGDALEVLRGLPSESVHCCITSPPYWGLRDYGVEGQLGLEDTPEEYVENLVAIFREVKRVLRDDGTLWLNLGDCHYGSSMTGGTNSIESSAKRKGRMFKKPSNCTSKQGKSQLKPKDLVGIPWMVAFALRADGWYLRQDIIWHKPNPMPESVTDRPTKAHEYVFLLTRKKKYFYDAEAIKEKQSGKIKTRRFSSDGGVKARAMGKHISGGNEGTGAKWTDTGFRNKRSVWTIPTKPFKEAHFATFPPDLIEPCILAGTSPMACPHCGAPWKRMVKVESGQGEGKPYDSKRPDGLVFRGRNRPSKRIELGWYPTCSCPDNDGSGRCVVLDPFLGSGTTLLVAQRLGRSGIGIELNPDYCAMASRRIDREQWSGSRRDDAGR